MCGIIGCLNDIPNESLRQKALHNLHHRGPDSRNEVLNNRDSFIFWLGHVRLSIVDLDERSSQPFRSKCGRYLIAFNGEIYNYQDLREKLKRKGVFFRTKSDTEVLLNGLIDEGIDFLHNCEGMWAFVFIDLKLKKTILCRDRFGVKPLYFYKKEDKFYFGSEVKALITFLESFKINSNYKNLFEKNHFLVEKMAETWIKDIYSLKAGSYLVLDRNNIIISQKKWWTLHQEMSKYKHLNIDELKILMQSSLDNSISKRLICDVNTGLTLSDGLDSTLISTLASSSRSDLKNQNRYFCTYTAKTNINNDNRVIEDASVLSKSLGLNHKVINLVVPDRLASIEERLWLLDIPYAFDCRSQLVTYHQISQDKTKVVLEGHGLDEALSGYGSVPLFSLANSFSLKKAKGYIDLVNKVNASPEKFIYNSSFNALKMILKYSLKSTMNIVKNPLKNFKIYKSTNLWLNYFERELYECTTETILPTLLRVYDRCSMASSIESRAPYLDHKFMAVCHLIPGHLRTNPKNTKEIIRSLYSKKLPNRLLSKPNKSGWLNPMLSDLKGESGKEIVQLFYENGEKHYANRLKNQIDNLKTFNDARKFWKANIFSIYEIIFRKRK